MIDFDQQYKLQTMTRAIILIAATFLVAEVKSQIRLPRLISDGVVLQRDVTLKIWGWASADEKVELNFKGKKFTTQADKDGRWEIKLPSQPSGGPFEMKLIGKNEVSVKDILFGDVWVCSGQSNMELDMNRVRDKYPEVVANAMNDEIRQFLVPDKYDFKTEHNDMDGGSWVSVNPKSIYTFSAVGYFFAVDLYKKYKVPIGLINSALGGSPVESWMSEDALKAFPDHYDVMQKFKNDDVIEEIETQARERSRAWFTELNKKDEGIKKWSANTFDDSDWNEMSIPGYWADGPLRNVNGSVWFRKKINIPKSMMGQPGKIWMGRIVDADSVFLNGTFVGTVSYQYPPRKYQFNENVLKEGDNTIAVRVINSGGRGGFVLDKPYFLSVRNDTIDLKGIWKYKLGATMEPLQGSTTVRWKPGGLFNRMIAPLLDTSIKGVIWYQGESNAGRAKEYEKLFPAMIKDWRQRWRQGDFPFLYVQLANFMEAKSQPSESQWAALREAQRKTLTVANTGMAVITDVGEWNDIHPLNKETVGKRLSLIAQSLAYNDKKVTYSGPVYAAYKIDRNKVIISFKNTGKLVAKGGTELQYFTIAGSDKKFVWAKASIKGNSVIVWSDSVQNPVAVRYAWADNPEGANLYNDSGLPASPFTTEDTNRD